MDVEVAPTKKVVVLGVDKRSLENLAWCAITYDVVASVGLTVMYSVLRYTKNPLNKN